MNKYKTVKLEEYSIEVLVRYSNYVLYNCMIQNVLLIYILLKI